MSNWPASLACFMAVRRFHSSWSSTVSGGASAIFSRNSVREVWRASVRASWQRVFRASSLSRDSTSPMTESFSSKGASRSSSTVMFSQVPLRIPSTW